MFERLTVMCPQQLHIDGNYAVILLYQRLFCVVDPLGQRTDEQIKFQIREFVYQMTRIYKSHQRDQNIKHFPIQNLQYLSRKTPIIQQI